MNKNLIYFLAGGVAVYLIVRAMKNKQDSDEANFLNASGKRKGDPCGCYGSKWNASRGTAVGQVAGGGTLCENTYGYTYVCNQSGARAF